MQMDTVTNAIIQRQVLVSFKFFIEHPLNTGIWLTTSRLAHSWVLPSPRLCLVVWSLFATVCLWQFTAMSGAGTGNLITQKWLLQR